jgi:hypothetical protein
MRLIASDDFDALSPSETLEANLTFFARAAVARMRASGFGASVEVKGSSIRFARDGARADALHLALTIDSRGVEVALRVPSASRVSKDFLNVRASSRIPELALALTSLLEELPEPFAMGPSGELKRLVPPVHADLLRAVLERCEVSGLPFWIGWSISRELAEANADSLDEELQDALLALVPLARMISWDASNDYLVPERPKLPQLPERDHDVAAPAPTRRRLESADDEEDEEELLPEPSVPIPSLAPRELFPRPKLSRRTPLVTEIDPNVVIEKGVTVRVLEGPFMGKIGVVSGLDGRGKARVLVGLLATTCDVRDLVATRERARRPLGSSHRRFKRSP